MTLSSNDIIAVTNMHLGLMCNSNALNKNINSNSSPSPRWQCHPDVNVTQMAMSPRRQCHSDVMSPQCQCHPDVNVTQMSMSPRC